MNNTKTYILSLSFFNFSSLTHKKKHSFLPFFHVLRTGYRVEKQTIMVGVKLHYVVECSLYHRRSSHNKKKKINIVDKKENSPENKKKKEKIRFFFGIFFVVKYSSV